MQLALSLALPLKVWLLTPPSGGGASSPGHPVGLFPYLWTKNATSVAGGSEEELLIYVY